MSMAFLFWAGDCCCSRALSWSNSFGAPYLGQTRTSKVGEEFRTEPSFTIEWKVNQYCIYTFIMLFSGFVFILSSLIHRLEFDLCICTHKKNWIYGAIWRCYMNWFKQSCLPDVFLKLSKFFLFQGQHLWRTEM